MLPSLSVLTGSLNSGMLQKMQHDGAGQCTSDIHQKGARSFFSIRKNTPSGIQESD